MESLGLIDLALIVGTSVGGAVLIIAVGWLIARYTRATPMRSRGSVAPTFLFDGDTLTDATQSAQNMIADAASNLSDRQAVISLFQDRFPTLDHTISHLGSGDVHHLLAADEAAMSLRVEDVDGLIRLTLLGANGEDHETLSETAIHDGLTREVTFLRSLVDTAPFMMWTQDTSGKLTWANAAYMRLSDRQAPDSDKAGQSWPQRSVFPDFHLDADESGPVSRRASVADPDSTNDDWFDVTTCKLGREAAHFAADASAAIIAEHSKVKAMQTSARLFGDLSTGLAIFDQRRRLTMFNPALTDLTRLQPSFLTGRPTVDMFLDALRDSRMLPEPKNYTTWRDQFTALETAARAGTYCENWDLIDGETFRVTGKPYADKSFVFLFEDITAEVALTRRFRTDIETGQSVLDSMADAIAVFSANGTLVMSNLAYKDLWGSDHDDTVHLHDLRGEIGQWQVRCAAAPAWADLRAYVSGGDASDSWEDHIILADGRHVLCEAQRINRRSTMITFKLDQDKRGMNPVIHKLTVADPALQGMKR